MCGCVPGEVLRQCSAANPADIIMRAVRPYLLILYFMPDYYYMVLPALAINAAFKPRLAASALHTASFI